MSAKGSTWKNHKYIKKINRRYVYFEEKLPEKISHFDDKIKKTRIKKTRIKKTKRRTFKVRFKIPNVKMDSNTFDRGMKAFKNIYSSYMSTSYKIGKGINKGIRKIVSGK